MDAVQSALTALDSPLDPWIEYTLEHTLIALEPAWTEAYHAGTLAAGCGMVIVPRFSASTFWQTAVDYGATEVNVIEAIGTILKNRPRSEFRPEHRIRAVYGVRHSMEPTFRDDFRIPHLIGGYGMTEIPGVTCNPIEGLRKPGSMGPIGRHPDPARPWAQCRVVDDEGRDVGVNEEGELLVKTPIIMQGYFRDPEQTREAIHKAAMRLFADEDTFLPASSSLLGEPLAEVQVMPMRMQYTPMGRRPAPVLARGRAHVVDRAGREQRIAPWPPETVAR